MRLNDKQQAAVKAISGPVLVLAGAGSGKTSVITQKIQYLLSDCYYEPENIAAVTFTNKAAREMKERLAAMLGPDKAEKVRTSTFHTLGMTILKADINKLGRSRRFSIFDEQDAMKLLGDLTERQLKGDKQQLYRLKMQIADWKNAGITAQQAVATARHQQAQFDALIYAAYDDHISLCNALDFDDLIALPVQLLKEHEDIRSKWQSTIRYLLVDEYQDTNEAQYQLIKLIAGVNAKFTVVGDDDQSIYAWRGAKPENLNQLQTDFPQLEVVKLEQNYRCSQRVLRVANHLIAHNPHLFEKSLWSQHQDGDRIRIMTLDDEEQEAEWVVADIMSCKIANRRKYEDFAILYRGNHQAKLFEKALIQQRIPYQMSGGQSFFARSEVRDLMAYFRLLSNPDDDAACQRVINVPRRAIGTKTLQTLAQHARDTNQSLYRVCQNAEQITALGAKAQGAIQTFVSLIEAGRKNNHFDARHFVNQLDYDHWLMETSSTPKAAEFRWNNALELCRWIDEGLQQQDEQDLADVINQLLIRELQQQEEQGDAVQMLTLHAAKGLEFKEVYMVGMEEELLPHRSSIEEDTIEEERRLCYVGITRAKECLSMTMARKRRRFGDSLVTEPSRFLQELPEDELEWPDQQTLTEEEQRDKNDFFRDQLASLLDD
jgi:ATP-dependent DNA helicase Rep